MLRDELRDAFADLINFSDGRAAARDGGSGSVCCFLDAFDLYLGVLGGFPSQLGETADFGGDDRESAPSHTGAGRFDGGIECQQMGLFGDRVDRFDDGVDVG